MYTKSLRFVRASACLAGLVSVSAFAQQGPFITIQVDGVSFDGPALEQNRDESGKIFYSVENFLLNGKTEQGAFQVQISGILSPDPSIAYGLAVVDLGAPSVFGFAFATPIVPTGSPNLVDASIVGGLTDFTGDGVSITPTSAFVQSSGVSFPLTNMGVDVGPGAAFGPGAPGAFYAYGPYAAGPQAGPGPGPWTFLTATAAFTLSGGGDVAALTGFAQIVEAPVPESGTVFAGGALALGIAGWLLRRRQALR